MNVAPVCLASLGAALLFVLMGCSMSSHALSSAVNAMPLPVPVLSPAAEVPDRLPSPPAVAELPPPARPAPDPEPPPDGRREFVPATQPSATLELDDVLASVDEHFPLLLAIVQEVEIASGQRLAAEGGFDLNLRGRGSSQGGSFSNSRLDVLAEQATPYNGMSLFSGYRFGQGDFPVYYGDRLTADGGEFRTGIVLPMLRDHAIDRRRANLRQAQVAEDLANPAVQRARIDYFRAGAQVYWRWVSAGELYRVADGVLRIARDRQRGLEEQFQRGQIAEFVVIDNRRLIAEREGMLIAAERRFQQAAIELSLYWRGVSGKPQVPTANQLPSGFAERQPHPPNANKIHEVVAEAQGTRPELLRFALLKERAAIDLQLACNQRLPTLNAAVAASQDVGEGKSSTGIFALERSAVEGSLLLEVPLQRREATGRVRVAQATLRQLLAQERFARDQIGVEVQDSISNLDRTFHRLGRAREEKQIAQRVAELERERFEKGQGTLLEVNLRELTSAGAQAKVIEALGDFFRAEADLRAALGLDAHRQPDFPND